MTNYCCKQKIVSSICQYSTYITSYKNITIFLIGRFSTFVFTLEFLSYIHKYIHTYLKKGSSASSNYFKLMYVCGPHPYFPPSSRRLVIITYLNSTQPPLLLLFKFLPRLCKSLPPVASELEQPNGLGGTWCSQIWICTPI